ncbi:MAG: hypothetical protein LQ337_004482 [Flavoplaca oasis]|nr:MAG: hypothetical protein LQ337_004482 [Flavoplaca oasis]
MRFSKFRALCKELFCGCTSLQSKEETASPAPRPIISAPIPHFKEWVQDHRDVEKWNPAYGKWISDGIHEPYQEKRKWDTYGDPFVPKRLPIPHWQHHLRPCQMRAGARQTSSVYSRPTSSPHPSVRSLTADYQEWIDAGLPDREKYGDWLHGYWIPDMRRRAYSGHGPVPGRDQGL